MRLAAGLFVAVCGLAWALSGPSVGAQEATPTRAVEGQVVNGTADVGDAVGITVVLHKDGASRHEHREATTDAQGRFRFEGVAFDPGTVYGVSVTYGEALYGIDLDLSVDPEPVTITIYEPVQDDSLLKITAASVVFDQVDKATQTLWALEIVTITNDTDRAYVPGPEPMQILRFGLPPGAVGLTVDTALLQASVIQVEKGFGLVASVPPGEHEVMYAYSFPYAGDEVEFSRSFRYGADRLKILVPHDVADLASGQLGSTESVVIGERVYRLISAQDVPRGANVTLTLVGLPTASRLDRARRHVEELPWELAAPAFLAVLLGGVIVLALWRRGFAEPADGKTHRQTSSTQAAYEDVLLSIARLDRSFENDEVYGADYDRARAALASRLAAVSRLRDTGS